jgi:hypothetical protein
VRKLIDDLLERKRAGFELGEAPAIPALADFINQEFESFGGAEKTAEYTKPWEPLDICFRSLLSGRQHETAGKLTDSPYENPST